MTIGGWPGFAGLDVREAMANVRDYAETIAAVDIDTAGPTGIRSACADS